MTSNCTKPLSDNQLVLFKEVLTKLGNNTEYTIHLSSGVEERENCCGIITNVEIIWSEEQTNLPSYFTIKCIPTNTILRSFLPIDACYERETYMYSKVFLEFQKLQNEKNIIKPFSIPKFYETAANTKEMLVLQNMKKMGYRHTNRHLPLDYHHTVAVIKEYARLHALSFATRDQKPNLFDELAENTSDHFFKDFDKEGVLEIAKHRIESALKSLDPIEDKQVYEKFYYYAKNFTSITKRLIQQKDAYSVISHIDTGIPNILFRYEEEVPSDVCILDWQLSRLASPAVDLTTFIFSACDKTLRNRYDDIILEYYKTLSLFLEELGSDPKLLLPFSVLQEQLKAYSIVGLFFALQLIYVYTTAKIPDVFNDDSHKDGFSFIYEQENRSELDKRIRDAIIDFDKNGYNFC